VVGQRHHHPGPATEDRADQLHSPAAELGGHEPGGEVGSARRDQPGLAAEGDHPGGHVGRLPADPHRGARGGVRLLGERPAGGDDDVEVRVAEHAYH
jgi:hypothetical protein